MKKSRFSVYVLEVGILIAIFSVSSYGNYIHLCTVWIEEVLYGDAHMCVKVYGHIYTTHPGLERVLGVASSIVVECSKTKHKSFPNIARCATWCSMFKLHYRNRT